MDERIYTERKILVGVAIGGPLAGGYYFWRTLKGLGREHKAWIAPVAAVLILLITYGCAFLPPLDRIPNFVFWGLQFGVVYGITRGYLLHPMTEYIATGRPVYGWGNTLVVSVLSMILTVGPMLGLVFWKPALFDNTQTRYYGSMRHEIVFDPANIREIEVGHLASALTSAGFFDEAQQKTVDAAKSGDRIIITTYCNESARDPDAIKWFRDLRNEVQKSFPTNPVVIDMVIGTPDNRITRLE